MKKIKRTKRGKGGELQAKSEEKRAPGRIPKLEKELDLKEKDFALLTARGIPDNIIKDKLKLTRYLLKEYKEDPRIILEVKRLTEEVFSGEDIEKWVAMQKELDMDCWQGMKKLIEEGKATWNQMEKMWMAGQIARGLMPHEEKITESITEKKQITTKPAKSKQKRISLFEDGDIEPPGEDEPETTKTQETTISRTKE